MSPVAILGPGLIGGSLGLALKECHPAVELRVWARRPGALSAVERLGFAAVATTDLEAAVRGARTVVLCTPVEAMPDLVSSFSSFLSADALVTDVGSVKGSVASALTPLLGARFVGAHPIAGSDRAGIQAASAGLYEGATCAVTPSENADSSLIRRCQELWAAVGCRVITLPPEEHDAILARTSHLPHAVASALVLAATAGTSRWRDFIGGGYRDTTRIAGSNPDLWTGILLANPREVSIAIADFIKILQKLREALDAGDAGELHRLLAEARDSREKA